MICDMFENQNTQQPEIKTHRDMEIHQQRDLKDIKNEMSMVRSSFEQRDLQSAQEIETLHKKCRCLTKL